MRDGAAAPDRWGSFVRLAGWRFQLRQRCARTAQEGSVRWH